MINLMVAFIVAYLLFMLLRWLVLPRIRIFPYIYPEVLWVSVYNVFLYICNAIFHWVLAFLLFLYIIWFIIMYIVPKIFLLRPFKPVLLRIPPIWQFHTAGVLPLMDSIRKIIFSNDSLGHRFARVGQSLNNFVIKSMGFLFGTFAGSSARSTNEKMSSRKIKNEKSQIFSKEEEAKAMDSINQCVEESTTPIRPDMTSMQKAIAMTKNDTATMACKAKQVGVLTNILSVRL